MITAKCRQCKTVRTVPAGDGQLYVTDEPGFCGRWLDPCEWCCDDALSRPPTKRRRDVDEIDELRKSAPSSAG